MGYIIIVGLYFKKPISVLTQWRSSLPFDQVHSDICSIHSWAENFITRLDTVLHLLRHSERMVQSRKKGAKDLRHLSVVQIMWTETPLLVWYGLFCNSESPQCWTLVYKHTTTSPQPTSHPVCPLYCWVWLQGSDISHWYQPCAARPSGDSPLTHFVSFLIPICYWSSTEGPESSPLWLLGTFSCLIWENTALKCDRDKVVVFITRPKKELQLKQPFW